jgi:putative phosphoribosyl transferase
MRFQDRADAGRRLAEALHAYVDERPVVLAIPRGGVPVAAEVARALGAPLDVIVVRKIGAPGFEEYAVGALVDGPHPVIWLDPIAATALRLDARDLAPIVKRERDEWIRREALYRGGRPPADLEDRTVIVVDDGIATGATARAALRSIRRSRPQKVVLAVPVAAAAALEALAFEADAVVRLEALENFDAVGRSYADFRPVPDAAVVAALGASGRRPSGASARTS